MTPSSSVRARLHPLVGCRIGVLGSLGSGRTTLSVLLARELARRGYHVCIVDTGVDPADSCHAFGIDDAPNPLQEFLASRGVEAETRTIPYRDQEISAPVRIRLEDLPDDAVARTPEGIVFLSLERAWSEKAGEVTAPTWSPQDIRVEGERTLPVTLFKLEAGPDTLSPDLLETLDWVLLIVDPTFSSVQLAADIGERVVQLQREAPAETEAPLPVPGGDPQGSTFGPGHHTGLLTVLNHVPDPQTEQFFVTAISRQVHLQPVGAIREDREIREAGARGRPVPGFKAGDRVSTIIDRIEESERRALSLATA